MQYLLVYSRAARVQIDQPILPQGPPFLEDTIRRLFEGTKWAVRRGGAATCLVRKPAAQYFLFWGQWAGMCTAMGYALR